MARRQYILSEANRGGVVWEISGAPEGTRVEIKAPRRSIPQNDKLWAMLTDVSEQLTWYGRHLSTDAWKDLFMDALNSEADIVPSLDGHRSVNIGNSTSDLDTEEFAQLIEIMFAFGAEHGVVWSYGPDNWGMDRKE